MPNLSPCGTTCPDCPSYEKSECAGCSSIQGKVYWAPYVSATVCPVYNCVVNEKKLPHCGKCQDLPCKMWYDLKDPSYTDEQHEKSIRDRVERLRGW